MTAQGKIYLEDLSVGYRFATPARTVEADEITAFARQFDPQPFHVDPEAAARSLFGGLVASGWHTAAMTMRLLVEHFPLAGGLIGLGGQAEWPHPVRPGDILAVWGEIIDIRPSRSHPDRGIVTARLETRNQRELPVQILTAKMMGMRRSSGLPLASDS